MHGGFNPNIAFPHHPPPRGPSVFSTETSLPYGGLSVCASSPAIHRHGPLFPPPVNPHEFGGGTRSVFGQMPGDDSQAFMDDIIMSGSAVTASYPGGEDGVEDGFTGEQYEEEYGDDAEEEEQPVAVAKGKNKKKAVAEATKAEPRVKWTSKENECNTP